MSERDNLVTALMTRYDLDESSAQSVINYAKYLSSSGRKANDFALAKALGDRANSVINTITDAYSDSSLEAASIDITDLNRNYILLVNELKKLYGRNQELAEISPEPVWKYFDVIEGVEWELREYLNNSYQESGNHNAQVNKLCVINGREEPKYEAEHKKLVKATDDALKTYQDSLNLNAEVNKAFTPKDWFIPEYKLTYGLNGTILVNDVLRLKKLNSGSISEKIMEQAQKQPNTLFRPELRTSRNLSTSLSSMGFKDALRQIFFPVVNQHKGILYRPVVSRSTVDAENINTSKLDYELKKAGAVTESYPIDIPF